MVVCSKDHIYIKQTKTESQEEKSYVTAAVSTLKIAINSFGLFLLYFGWFILATYGLEELSFSNVGKGYDGDNIEL